MLGMLNSMHHLRHAMLQPVVPARHSAQAMFTRLCVLLLGWVGC